MATKGVVAVTREMLSAAHAVTLARGDVILSADLLTRIYEAMRARSYVNPARHVSYACPVCAASLEPGLDALRIACDDAMVLYTPAFDHPRTKPVAVIEASGVDDVQVEATSESLDDKVDAMREAIFEMHDKILRKKQGA